MARKNPVEPVLEDLLYQALQTEQGGIRIYTQAIACALNDDLRHEWQEYLEETTRHEQVITGVIEALGLDPAAQTPGRRVVAGIGDALVAAMEQAQASATPEAAELVAAECVVLAETKDHSNWELIGHVAQNAPAAVANILRPAFEDVEEDEDHHLYHTRGWMRELWIQALGYPAALPPPEEVKKVETAIGASRAEQAREEYIGRKRKQ
ncbi:ferritin-like domain-containing protein [Chiayiivirga flava]|uniref:DUF892 family protein n=1 Tax=Chiayiivirga flava TaxID=659595 RepID=A0A7W8FXL8_9GAMM|nr:ferritin-like domain-containing protein [Chiayiivirga flava]MBB5206512.1 hypothetical protein [Chiayiivirga flava]